MRGLGPRIHVLILGRDRDVDGRDKPGHDERKTFKREQRGAALICPSCQRVAGTHPCGVGQITGTCSRVPCPWIEGRFAIVTKRWARDAVDAFGARDERSDKRTAKSCGPDIPTLISTRDNALHCAGTETRKPGLRGEHEGSR